MLEFVDRVGRKFSVGQLGFIVVVLLIAIGILGPYKLMQRVDVGTEGMLNSAVNPTRPWEECPEIPANYQEIWSWCHGSRYKVCKANYPYQKKTEDLMLIINRISLIFDRHRIKWWLDFHTLQSAVQEGHILPWDYHLEISVIEKRFRQYYPQVMEELHQCNDPLSPLYYKRYSNSDSNLRGKFETKYEPRFWVEINTWNHDEKKNLLTKAGWGSSEKEKLQIYTEIPYHYVEPTGRADFNGTIVPVPGKSRSVLDVRFGGKKWQNIEPPSYYRPDLRWGSEEMKSLHSK